MSLADARNSRVAIASNSRVAVARADAPQPAPAHRRVALAAVELATHQRRKRTIASGLVAALLFVAAVFTVVTMHVNMAENGFGLQDLQTRVAAEQRLNLQLKAEVARASSPDVVVPLAERIGLKIPAIVTPIAVDGVPTTPAQSSKVQG